MGQKNNQEDVGHMVEWEKRRQKKEKAVIWYENRR